MSAPQRRSIFGGVFEDVVGQARVIEALLTSLAIDRLPHGVLFCGPSGVGKAMVATRLAALFLADEPAEPDSVDQAFTLLAASGHPDFHRVYKEQVRQYDRSGTSKARDLSINVIRNELNAVAARKSVLGRGKVFVIEDADYANIEAQNAMLKTLEEPNGRTLIVLLAEQPLQLLPTIRSRCQTFTFAPLSEEACTKILKSSGIDAGLALAATRLAQGSPGTALRFIQDNVLLTAQQIFRSADQARDSGRLNALQDELKAAADAAAEKAVERDALASKDMHSRSGGQLYVQLLAEHLSRQLSEASDPASLERLCMAIDACVRAEKLLEMNVRAELAYQQLALAMTRR